MTYSFLQLCNTQIKQLSTGNTVTTGCYQKPTT